MLSFITPHHASYIGSTYCRSKILLERGIRKKDDKISPQKEFDCEKEKQRGESCPSFTLGLSFHMIEDHESSPSVSSLNQPHAGPINPRASHLGNVGNFI